MELEELKIGDKLLCIEDIFESHPLYGIPNKQFAVGKWYIISNIYFNRIDSGVVINRKVGPGNYIMSQHIYLSECREKFHTLNESRKFKLKQLNET